MTNVQQKLTIQIGSFEFDPLYDKPSIRKDLQAERNLDNDHFIIQFTEPLNQEEQIRIQRQFGLLLKDYVPNFAYLELVKPDILKKISKDKIFRASFLYQPAFKISPNIGNVVFDAQRQKEIQGVGLFVILFPQADVESITNRLIDIGMTDISVTDDRKIGGVAQIRFIAQNEKVLSTIAQMSEVRLVSEIEGVKLDNGTTAGTVQSGSPVVTSTWNAGIHGENQIIGIIDHIVDINHCFFRDKEDDTVGPNHRKVIGFRNTSGSTGDTLHGTFVAGIALGDDVNNIGTHTNRGIAWAARMTYGNLFDLNGKGNSLLKYLKDAFNDGAAIHTNSWHFFPFINPRAPQYSQKSADVDNFVWMHEDNLVVGSSGEKTDGTMGPPCTAKNSLCVSATKRHPNEMDFGDGMIGPTYDGRRKPEIMAPGCSIVSAKGSTDCDVLLDGDIWGSSTPICASSWAAPAIAGAAALVRQYFIEGFYPSGTSRPYDAFVPSGALLKATLLNSTIDITGISDYPNNQEGWGLVRLNNVLFFPGSSRKLRVWDLRNKDGISTGKTHNHQVYISTNTQPLKVTLTWYDPPALADSVNPIVNNLDLRAISPDGSQTFLGNVFSGGVSTTGGTADSVNNVEMVLVNKPIPGNWSIQVIGTSVNVGNPGQGYALVVTSDIT